MPPYCVSRLIPFLHGYRFSFTANALKSTLFPFRTYSIRPLEELVDIPYK